MVRELRVGHVQHILDHTDAERLGREQMEDREPDRVRERMKTATLGAEPLRVESRRFHPLSDPIRLSILHLLSAQPICVCVIKDVLHVPDSKLSYHLSVLQSTGCLLYT